VASRISEPETQRLRRMPATIERDDADLVDHLLQDRDVGRRLDN
jgi:hypothetical protein